MTAHAGDTVRVHYTGKLKDGNVFDTSTGRDPLQFTLGKGEVIPGFEKAIDGMEKGESRTVEVESEKAYGPHRDELIMAVPRDQFPDDAAPEVGKRVRVGTNDGGEYTMTIVEISNENVTLDANHPLAGENLVFDITLEDIVAE
jgi:peptidylprolyl isomerase